MSSAFKNQTSSDIFNISQTYNYNLNGVAATTSNNNNYFIGDSKMMLGSLDAASRSNLLTTTSGGLNGSTAHNTSSTSNGSQQQQQQAANEGTVDIQAQFELAVELRRFINIDLFQRGFYHIRLAIKCANKTIPTRIMVQLENSNNNYLSDVMFPSCIIDEYAVSKTFLILYKNEEIILDDQILFKISSLMNAFNILESFEKLDLQLNVELWFTESDYKPPSSSSTNGGQNSSYVDPNTNSTSLSSGGAGNLNQTTSNGGGMNTSGNSANTGSGGGGGSSMQLLCSRTLKIKFDPRHGLHLQMPVLFDYFHLSSVLVTIHCSLLTLLPPVMLGTNTQRNLTLSSILFGQELSQFKNPADITSKLMSRAVNLHNQICSLLLASYDNLQDHIVKMSNYLTEYERKKLNLELVDCQEKLHKLTEIAQMCSEAEALDDLANRHVAQLSAENIMLWCLYIDNFTFNQPVSEHLATEYHIRRLKRFSEAFFVKDLPKKHIIDYEPGENYQTIHDVIKQSIYYQQLPELAVSCDELDGLPDQLPIVFEENYVLNSAAGVPAKLDHQHSSGGLSINHNHTADKFFSTYSQFSAPARSTGRGSGKNSQSSSTENSTSNAHQSTSDTPLNSSNKKLHKKLKKKLLSTGDVFLDNNGAKRAITLVSYKKTATDDQLNLVGLHGGVTSGSGSILADHHHHVDLNSSLNSSMMSRANSVNSHHLKLSQIKADLLNSNSSSSEFKEAKTSGERGGGAADDSSISIGLDQLDLSNINNSGSNLNTAANDDYVSDEDVNNDTTATAATTDAAAPVDFSIKSRALYESFRGKMNTLEKKPPGSAVRVVDGDRKMSQNSTNSTSGGETALVRTSSSNRRTSSLSTNSSNHLNDSSRSLDVNLLNGAKRTQLVNNVVIDRALKENIELNRSSNDEQQNLSSQSVSLQPSPQKSFHFVGENLFKFVLAKEEIKRILNAKYPGGNIYSEFSSFFCSAPYFYPHLTPKLVLPPTPPTAAATTASIVPNPPVASSSTASTTTNSSTNSNHPPVVANKERKGSFFRRNSRTSKASVDKNTSSGSTASSSGGGQQAVVQTASSSMTVNPRASFTSTISSKAKVFRLSSTDSSSNNNANNYDVTSDETVKEKEIPIGGNNNDASNNNNNNQDYSYYTDSDEEDVSCMQDEEKVHLVVCVHGLEGNSGDLRLIRTYLELALPGAKMDFLMSEQNQENTFDDLETMTVQLIKEINHHIEAYGITPDRISFIGHSLGNLIIRSAVAHDNFKPHRDKLYTYLSLSGPHLGTLYNSSGLVNMGLWIMQKWKRSGSLLQLSLKDHSDLKQTFLYKLSKKPTLEYFKNVLLVASTQDRYVPFHSARIEMCKAAYKDNQYGNLYREMVLNILKPVIENPSITFKRYSTFYSLQSGNTTSNLIGRAAHIAVLDSELFVEKLVLVSVAKHFR